MTADTVPGLQLAQLRELIRQRHRKLGAAAIWAQAVGCAAGWERSPGGGAIGRAGTMPWHLPEDLSWFKTITGQGPVIMGSRTWLSLPPRFRPLPGRHNIVVSRRAQKPAQELTQSTTGTLFAGAELAPSLQVARQLAGQEPVWIIGGGQLYAEALKDLELVVITQIAKEVPDADTFAPELDPKAGWQLLTASEEQKGKDGTRHIFTVWQRTGGSLRV